MKLSRYEQETIVSYNAGSLKNREKAEERNMQL